VARVRPAELDAAIAEYARRERRFGAVERPAPALVAGVA
jgi:hypothetical protein